MKKNILIAVAVIIVLAGGIAAYLYWQDNQSKPETVQQVPPPAPPSLPAQEPAAKEAIEALPEQPVLPKLSESDKFMLDTMADLVGDKSLMKLFYTKWIIRKIVATIDNLPRKRVSPNVMPVKRAPGKFITKGPEEGKTISPKNATRYAAYMKIAEMADPQKLVEVYVRLYPLFQQAYEELGYPKKYFNDRLLTVLDHLLDAPDLKEPVALVQPNVFYLYAKESLEARSAGQKILMRIGSANEAKIKSRLSGIKQQIMLHMRDQKIDRNK